MRKFLMLAVCLSWMTSLAHAETFLGLTNIENTTIKDAVIVGPATLKQVKATSLAITGPLKFTKIEVEKNAVITGPVSGKDGKFSSLSITGPLTGEDILCEELHVTGFVNITHLKVSKASTIIGSLTATKSSFQDLTITADDVVLDSSTVQTITMRKNTDKQQVLTLKGDTIVHGDITFESGKGKIIESKNVKIKGKVKGAVVTKE